MEMADISNLDPSGTLRPATDHFRLTALGNRLRHSDGSFRALPDKYSLLLARTISGTGGNTEFADMRGTYDALNNDLKGEIADLITEHSNAYSREQIGIARAEYGEENQVELEPVRQRLARHDAPTGRHSL
jgi:alpha-ketoglutarate-dependent 2,4-dichlorophenoxyacetate dioxygenase